MANEEQGRLKPEGASPVDPRQRERAPADPLKDSLKAVASAHRQVQAAAAGLAEDPERTALLNRREAKPQGQWPLNEALRAAEAALGTPGATARFTPEETPPTLAHRAGKGGPAGPVKTQLVRGPQRPTRSDFHQDPVVGWLVVIGGPGLGSFRPVFEGNNTIGRAASQRVPIDFGDDAISGEEQAYLRYDSADRQFLFVPNLAKTNVVSVNDAKPTTAVKLNAMDVITMGRTQLVFVPFCGEDFDWSELADLKE